MISACDTQDFAPFGREYVRHHPGEFQIQVQNVSHADSGVPLLKSFREFSLQETIGNKVRFGKKTGLINSATQSAKCYVISGAMNRFIIWTYTSFWGLRHH
jgi:hypothetical protein